MIDRLCGARASAPWAAVSIKNKVLPLAPWPSSVKPSTPLVSHHQLVDAAEHDLLMADGYPCGLLQPILKLQLGGGVAHVDRDLVPTWLAQGNDLDL